MELPWIDGRNPVFPHPETALADPDGLLAAGGRLDSHTLLLAYGQGIFPWFEEGQPVLWWSPSERAVLVPGKAHISQSLRKAMRRGSFTLTTNQAFADVIAACAAPRPKARGTWITPAMERAYLDLHRLGHAHSVECWQQGQLVGGLYGVQRGAVFCGESMFSRASNASKIAFAALSHCLAEQGFALIDCQLENPHLTSLGVGLISRQKFLELLAKNRSNPLNWPENEAFKRFLEGTQQGIQE